MILKAACVAFAMVLLSSTTALAKPSPLLSLPSVATKKPLVTANGAWTSYHRDDAHTGNDPTVPQVTSVTAGWTSAVLDDEIFAEPLIYNGIVYAASLNDTVYALDQSTGTEVWHRTIGTPQTTGWFCGNISTQGILGTPVIDVAASRIYVAAFFTSDQYWVYGLDLATGAIKLNTQITGLAGPTATFDWTIQQQRGALALANGYVYVPFGGRSGDCANGNTGAPYHGWVIGVPTNGSTSLNAYMNANGSGIWGAGGLAVDDTTGNVFAASGNSITDNCSSVNQNDAVVRLSPTLALQDYFMPFDWQNNWCLNDMDLGSAGPMLISPNLLFQSGKWGGGFLLDPNNLGGVDGQRFPTPKPATYAQANTCFGNTSDATFGSFAYAAPFVYLECEGRGLVALNVNTATPSFSPCDATCAAPDWHAGSGITFGPPIVAGGAVWAASDGGGLYAFNATTGAQIYHSAGFGLNHFVTPAEAGGQVFVASHTVIMSFNMVAAPPPAQYAVGVVGTDTGLWVLHSGSPTFAADGGVLLGAPAVVAVPQTSGPAVPLYIATGSDHGLYVRNDSQTWHVFGGGKTYCIDNPAGAVIAGTLYVACEGQDHALYHAETPAPTGTNLPTLDPNNWQRLGGIVVSGPAVASVASTPTYLVIGTDQHVYSRDLVSSSFTRLAWVCFGHPALATFGSTSYFACHGTDNGLWYATNSGGGWSAAQSLGGAITDGVGIAATAGGPVFFAQGSGGGVWHRTISTSWTPDGGQVMFGVSACAL